MYKHTLFLLTTTAAAVAVLAGAAGAVTPSPLPSTPAAVSSEALPETPAGPPPDVQEAAAPLMNFCVSLRTQSLAAAWMSFLTSGSLQNLPLLAVAACPADRTAQTTPAP
ncbi:hypothetical protein [Nonomuraea insulae]|uniref:Secreted protein n=1 Tax=Nonomuraea insulae TaxID=1616787 RepID=A0ABW1DEC2_9ACTN